MATEQVDVDVDVDVIALAQEPHKVRTPWEMLLPIAKVQEKKLLVKRQKKYLQLQLAKESQTKIRYAHTASNRGYVTLNAKFVSITY
ncbi:hypothetical protein Goshw_007245 [Gossypium schwendimanii]|uniref:Uncharacterized protein n=1 Tax=Gossypium schwendimanii TaxID=34291 RepID=A0A7J9MRQ0_GOSSC|nr:hypothetical protein [Gossypium schwendimanii]